MVDTDVNSALHSQNFIRILREVHEKAEKMRRLTQERLAAIPSDSKSHSSSPVQSYSIPTLYLPFPDDVDSSVHATGFPMHICTASILKIQRSISTLQGIYSRNFENACRKILAMPYGQHTQPIPVVFRNLRLAYESSYATSVSRMRTRALETFQVKVDVSNGSRKKNSFNTVSFTSITYVTLNDLSVRNIFLYLSAILPVMRIPPQIIGWRWLDELI